MALRLLVLAACLLAIGDAAATGPDGQIAFVRGRGIFVVNGDGTGLRRLTNPKRNIWDDAVAWAPDRSRLAFVRTDGETCGLPCIATSTIRPDGTGLEAVSDVSGEPRWSPDGSRFASTEFFGENQRGYPTMAFDVVAVTTGKTAVLAPRRHGRTSLLRLGYRVGGYAWSRDGAWLCFGRTVGSQARLGLIRPDGTGVRLLPTTGLSDCDWAADGAHLAATGNGRLYWVAIADGTATPLTDKAWSLATPHVSPDGTTIAYVRGGDLWTVATDGSGARLVAAGVSDVCWAPDGTALAFITPASRRETRAPGLWMTRLDGSPPVELAAGATELDWR